MHSSQPSSFTDGVSSAEDVDHIQPNVSGEDPPVDNVSNTVPGTACDQEGQLLGRTQRANYEDVDNARTHVYLHLPAAIAEREASSRLRHASVEQRRTSNQREQATDGEHPSRQQNERAEEENRHRNPHFSSLAMMREMTIARLNGYHDLAREFISHLNVILMILFFPKNSDPEDSFDRRTARAALKLTDSLVNRHYIFVWPIGEEGRMHLTIEQPGPFHFPIHVHDVWVKTENGCSYRLMFIQEASRPLTLAIKTPWSASVIQSPRLKVKCPEKGDISVRYVPLEIRMKIGIGDHLSYPIELIETIYAKVEKKKKIDLRRGAQWKENVIQIIPQITRDARHVAAAFVGGCFSKGYH